MTPRAAGAAAPGAGLGCLPRYQVQGLLDSGELVCMTVRGLSPRQRAWIAE